MKAPSERITFKNNAMSFPITKGFAVIKPYKNPDYASTTDKGFLNFGIINWIPSLTTNDTADFNFNIPNRNQKKIKILIEGFTGDGRLISEVKTIDFP